MGARALAAAITAFAFVGSGAYTLAHPKNPAAPLQPEIASPVAKASPRSTATVTPRPRITLQPGVRATEVPGITVTHVS
jgi:hypothetical protein